MMEERREEVRRALENIDGTLEQHYASGRIWYESDLHQVILSYLHRELVEKDPRWVIGSQHPFKHELGQPKPDVVCYFRSQSSYAKFREEWEASVVAFIEIKFKSDLNHDLTKLEMLEDKWPALTWMVYGDHFREDFHSEYCRQQEGRVRKVEAWKKRGPRGMRGSTILRCGSIATGKSDCGDALSALNSRDDDFWIFDEG